MDFAAPAGGCAVRMYRQGLGDCFLLAFADLEGGQKRLLIDCGVLVGTKDARQRMQAVVGDIRQATGGRLDILVVTHEHWDHVSGFVQARKEFERLEIGQVWLAWTEDENDPLARELRERHRSALRALGLAQTRWRKAHPEADSGLSARVEALLGFYGPGLATQGGSLTQDAMDWVKDRHPQPIYLKPGGEPAVIPGLEGPRFYVLGPPLDPKLIYKGDPAKGSGEVYLGDLSQGWPGLQFGVLEAEAGAAEPPPPFNPAYRFWGDAPHRMQIEDRYRSEPWRTIDQDYLDAVGQLALMLDNHTNNTSLALAIELSSGGPVLLFPGDAQRGNWSSWEAVRWTGAGAGTTAQDLLGRTVLYKVGHHGSHNATARGLGLELMNHPGLAALIPVDRETAAQKRWQMPYPPLFRRLLERTGGRLLLSDRGWEVDPAAPAVAEFAARCRETELYFEVAFPPAT